MLFRKKMPEDCQYCARSAAMDQEEVYLCSQYGVVKRRDICSKFQYDPCKRIPLKPKTMDFSKYDEEDFTL